MQKDPLLSKESKNIEYKVQVPKHSEKYIKTVVAFANGDRGQIVFGVEDETLKIVGIDPDLVFGVMDSIANAVSDHCEPKIIPDLSIRNIDGKCLIVLNVFPGTMRPYYLRSKGILRGTYIRIGSTTRPAEPYMVKDLILEGENRYFDKEICRELIVNEKDINQLCAQMKEVALRNTWNEHEKAQIPPLTRNHLLSWGILKEDY